MRINDLNLTGTSASETGRAQETKDLNRAGKTTASGVSGSSDRVEFSGTLSRLSRALSTFESSRASRIQALAANYQKGSYRPDAAAISKGMIDDAMSAGL